MKNSLMDGMLVLTVTTSETDLYIFPCLLFARDALQLHL